MMSLNRPTFNELADASATQQAEIVKLAGLVSELTATVQAQGEALRSLEAEALAKRAPVMPAAPSAAEGPSTK